MTAPSRNSTTLPAIPFTNQFNTLAGFDDSALFDRPNVYVSLAVDGGPPLSRIRVVSTPYESTGASGSIGIIGPTRMDYGKVVPLVGFTAKVMTKVLQGEGDDSE